MLSRKRLLIVAGFAVTLAAIAVGCASFPTQAAVDQLRSQAQTQPAGSPEQIALNAKADSEQKTVNTIAAVQTAAPAVGSAFPGWGTLAGYGVSALLAGLGAYATASFRTGSKLAATTSALQQTGAALQSLPPAQQTALLANHDSSALGLISAIVPALAPIISALTPASSK